MTAAMAALLLIYLPDIGHGFIRDDFLWIHVGRITSAADIARLLTTSAGFYRPAVLATFGLNHALSGLNTYPYALVNLGILLACVALIVRLARALGLGLLAGCVAAAAWALNFHGVGMALLWISGRTALLLTLFALLTVIAALRRRWFLAAVCCLLTLLSKEEAVVLPFIVTIWTWWSSDRSGAGAVRAVRDSWLLYLSLGIYVVLRTNSGAFGPSDAPPYYQFTFAPAHVFRNVMEYLDRSTTVPAAVAVIAMAASRRRPRLDEIERSAVAFGVLWLIGGFAITVFLPLRSDLYVLNPAIGSAIACGAIVQALERAAPIRVRRTLGAMSVLPLLLLPVYRERNQRWVRPADLSRQVLADLTREAEALPDGSHVVLVDSASEPETLENTFESLEPDGTAVLFGNRLEVAIVPDMTGVPPAATAVYRLKGGHLERVARGAEP